MSHTHNTFWEEKILYYWMFLANYVLHNLPLIFLITMTTSYRYFFSFLNIWTIFVLTVYYTNVFIGSALPVLLMLTNALEKSIILLCIIYQRLIKYYSHNIVDICWICSISIVCKYILFYLVAALGMISPNARPIFF